MKIKVAREGKEIGEFWPWEICERWAAGHLSMTDDYWREGMASWGKLQDIKEEIITSKRPAQATKTFTPPPTLAFDKQVAANGRENKRRRVSRRRHRVCHRRIDSPFWPYRKPGRQRDSSGRAGTTHDQRHLADDPWEITFYKIVRRCGVHDHLSIHLQ